MNNIYADLPEAIYIVDIHDAGEYGATTCPHCGAQGRFVITFMASDGKEHGAMKGCFKKFPQHRFAKKMLYLLDKEKSYKAKGWSLPTWDAECMEAIKEFANKTISESEAQDRINHAESAASAYRNRKFGRRR